MSAMTGLSSSTDGRRQPPLHRHFDAGSIQEDGRGTGGVGKRAPAFLSCEAGVEKNDTALVQATAARVTIAKAMMRLHTIVAS